jgi:hypothetical protein
VNDAGDAAPTVFLTKLSTKWPSTPSIDTTDPNLNSKVHNDKFVSTFTFPVIVDVLHDARLLVDSGATCDFVSAAFCRRIGATLTPLKKKVNITLADGTSGGIVTHETQLQLFIDHHLERRTFLVAGINVDLIVGMPWLTHHCPVIDYANRTMHFTSGRCLSKCLPQNPPQAPPQPIKAEPPGNPAVAMVSASSMHAQMASDDFVEVFTLTMDEIFSDQTEEDSAADLDEATILEKLPDYLHEFWRVCSKEEADKLPPHGPGDHEIPTQPGAKIPSLPLRAMSQAELAETRKILDEGIRSGKIRPSSSPAGAPVLFQRKKDGTLRFCVDYRGLNAVTRKDATPLPLFSETLARVAGKRYYSRLDMRAAFNQLRIALGDEWKTAFKTRYGLYEYLVMPFGLTGGPATMQRYVNNALREFLDDFLSVFIDDILIYSDTLEEHRQQLRKVFAKLREANLYINVDKCEFEVTSTTFLGYVISSDGVSMDESKVTAIKDWSAPRSVKDVQSFLGFANFYRRLVKDFARIAKPLHDLTRKDVKFTWSDESQRAFDELKNAFTSDLVMRHFDPDLPLVLETDASDYAIGAVLSQRHLLDNNTSQLHPIAYYSRKMTPPELNYGVGDKELLAIMEAFREWSHYLSYTPKPVEVLTDHANLTSFLTKQRLTPRQARWSDDLTAYNFTIVYRPGQHNARADALSRKPGDKPTDSERHPVSTLLNLAQFDQDSFRDVVNFDSISHPVEEAPHATATLATAATTAAPTADADPYPEPTGYDGDIQTALESDDLANTLLRALESQTRVRNVDITQVTHRDGLLYYYDKLYVPDDANLRRRLIQDHHDSLAAGHPGRAATVELLDRHFWWPAMRKTVERYIRNCVVCRRTKTSRHAPYGFLKPLPVPDKRWAHVSMDYIVSLPESAGCDAILVVVDRLSKMSHFIPCDGVGDTTTTAKRFVDSVFRLHGLPTSIVSDRGTNFVSELSTEICRLMDIKLDSSTAFHPETDGQTERVNQVVEQYIRAFCNYEQNNWVALLAFAEFAYNNTVSSTTGLTPFFANYGFHPRWLPPTVKSDTPDIIADQAERLNKLEEHLRQQMRYAQLAQAQQADKNRVAPPIINVGDYVWLSSRNIASPRPSKKLDHRNLGPFKVVKKVGSHAYRLDLPRAMDVHPVFHVNLLEKAAEDPLTGQHPTLPANDNVADAPVYDHIIVSNVRKLRDGLHYHITHTKHDGTDQTDWVHRDVLLRDFKDILVEFHRLNPSKPRPRGRPARA